MSGWAQRHADHAELHFPYNAAAVAAIKACVPYTARSWNPDGKSWIVREPYVDSALRTVSRVVGQLDVADLRPPKLSTGSSVDWASALFAALPENLRTPVYRALLKVLHPDIGGSTAMTQRLIDAFGDRRGKAS